MEKLGKLRLMALAGILAVAAGFLGGCAQFVGKEKSYATGAGVMINGATVRSAVKPNGGSGGMSFSAMVYSAGTGTLDGPFLWRVEATGVAGVHERLAVHRLKVTTSKTKRSEWYPAEHLGKVAIFKPVKDAPGTVFASYPIPGELEVYPEKDGLIEVMADVSVRTVNSVEREVVRFSMAPEESREVETVFLPAEIVKGFGEKDPRDWHWGPDRGEN